MGRIADAFNETFRDFITEGVPASGAYEPAKAAIRAIGELLDLEIGGGGGGFMEPITILTTASTVNDTGTWQTLDLSDYLPVGAIAAYLEFAVTMGTLNANTHWRFRAPGDVTQGLYNDGSRRFNPPQTAGITFGIREWVRVSADRTIEYQRSNSGGVSNTWNIVLWGYQ